MAAVENGDIPQQDMAATFQGDGFVADSKRIFVRALIRFVPCGVGFAEIREAADVIQNGSA